MDMRKPLLAANWKLYKTTQAAQEFCTQLSQLLTDRPEAANQLELTICPAFTLLSPVRQALSSQELDFVGVGAQNMAQYTQGAYTGEVSYPMLQDVGVNSVILGHSERRTLFAETDEAVNAKAKLALENNLTPIVCVGESLETREAGQTDTWVKTQVEKAIAGLSAEQLAKLVFAYEPIWAIGTGKVCESAEANRVCGLIRQWVGNPQTRVLYGGSVKPDNIEGLMTLGDIDGALVGGASLDAQSYFALIEGVLNAQQVTA